MTFLHGQGLRALPPLTAFKNAPNAKCVKILSRRLFFGIPICQKFSDGAKGGGENGGGVTAPKFCGFGLEFSQMFWDGGAFHASWAVHYQSENPSCPILRTSESLSKPVPNARCKPESWLLTTATQGLQIALGSGWDRFLISGDQKFGTFPPPLWTIRLPPPSQLCQQYQGTQFSTICFPPPHRNARHPIRFHPPRKCILDNCCRNVAKTVTQPALSGRRQFERFLWRWPLLNPFGLNM